MLKRLVILDGNHIAYRAYYKFPNLKNFNGQLTSVIYGMPYISESLIRRLGPDKVVAVFDGGRSPIRLGLLSSYKEREKKLGFNAEDFYKQKDLGRDILGYLGIRIAWEKHSEADDIITRIAKEYSKLGWETVIVSGDKDFNQLICKRISNRGNIMVYNTGKNGKLIDDFNLPIITGYTNKQALDYLILTGDKSDNIPGYPGIGPKRALTLLEKFGNIKKFLKSPEKFGKINKDELKRIYLLNKKLIDLTWFYKKHLKDNPIPWISPDKMDLNKLQDLCREYEINTFLKPQFLNTFKNLYK